MLALALCASLVACTSGSGPRGRLPLRQVAQLVLPGGADRFDYQTVDVDRHRLFIAHMDTGVIDVVDLRGPRLVGTIPNAPAVTGVLAIPSLGRLFASVTGRDEVDVYDEDSLALLGRPRTGRFPDGISYDPHNGRVYVSDESGRDLTALDATTLGVVGRVPLRGEPGNNAYDPGRDQVVVDVQTRNEVAIIDVSANRVTRRIGLPGCRHDHGLYLDPASRRGFVACDGNNRLVVVDLDAGEVLQRLPVGNGPDVLAFDAGLRRLYVASESGVLATFAERPEGALTSIGSGYLADNAHTVAVDQGTHRVYFAIRSLLGQPTLLVMQPTSASLSGGDADRRRRSVYP